MEPLISVIVPVYNVESYLYRCVSSIRKQTYQNLEIILVDDGSPDRCPELCEELRLRDSRIKVVHKINGGLGFARNSGLEVASGDYVTFIDSDDWISEDHIENLCREARRTDADVVIGSFTSAATDGSVCQHHIKLNSGIYEGDQIRRRIILPLIGADVHDAQDVQLESSSCMNLYRRDLISCSQLRFPSEKIAVSEDSFFNVDFLCNARRVAVMDEMGYFYFENMSSISRTYDSGRLERIVRFYENMREKIKKYGLEAEAAFRLERTFLMIIRASMSMIVRSPMKKKDKYRELRRVLEHQQVKAILKAYPIDTYSAAVRLLTKWMRAGNVTGVYWLIKIRQYSDNRIWLKRLMKRAGIGK